MTADNKTSPSAGAKPRTVIVRFKFSPEGRAIIGKAAKRAGLPLREFIERQVSEALDQMADENREAQ